VTDAEVAEIRIIGLPLALHRRVTEHYDELLREFTLLVGAESPALHTVPARLTALAEEVTDRFSGFTTEPESALAAALDSDAETIDLVYQLPPEVGDASARLDLLLDEAEEFCLAGAELLTLAAPPDVLAYRRWFLWEFMDQIAGRPPRAWPGVDAVLGDGPRAARDR
jgi:hypothetical protein